MKKALIIGMSLLLGIQVLPLTVNVSTVAAAQIVTPLANPTGLKATPGNNQVSLSWSTVTGAESYNVKRSLVNGGPYTTIASSTTPVYFDSSAVNGMIYYYVVTAVSKTTESMISQQIKASPYVQVAEVPAIPPDFAATANDGSVYLTWSKVTGASFYTVKRSETSGGPYKAISNALSSLLYTDNTVVNGKTYYYVVSASNSSGESHDTEELILAPSNVIVVSQDGTGHFMTVQDAVDSIPTTNADRKVIYIKAGVYREKVTVTKPFVSFIGEGRDKTKIVYNDSKGKGKEPLYTATVSITASVYDNDKIRSIANHFIAENLTFENDAPPSEGQALAALVNADQAVFENVKFVGYQDTLYAGIASDTKKGRQYYHNSVVTGRVDYIYGPATAAVFDHVDAISKGDGGFITAAVAKKKTDVGFVFLNSRLLKDSSTTGLHYLGRTWQDFPTVRYINTWMDNHIHPDGWTKMEVLDPSFYGEYNSMGPGANSSTRVLSTQMTAAEASDFTIPRIFDGWDPSRKVILPMDIPQVTSTAAPALPDGQSGSYTKPVMVFMEMNDSIPSADQVQQVQYRINGGIWNTYTAEFEVSGDGAKIIEYRVVDVSGNAGNIQFLTFTINSSDKPKIPAFPGAEGGGMYAKGGRGGKVYVVDNLNDYDTTKGEAAIPGSFRDAVSQGNRMIVFRTSGTINLKRGLDITNGNLTIAGQTAPGDGIALSGYMVKIGNNTTGDIIIRYIRFRTGISELNDVADITGDNIILDHCSLSWSTDEAFSAKNRKNFTVQWSIISDSLNHSIHTKGPHGYGGIWGGTNATYHHNLIVNHTSRNPRFDRAVDLENYPTKIDFRNNVIYNWGFNSAYGGEFATGINMINNYYKPGPNTFDGVKSRIVNPSVVAGLGGGAFYINGNFVEGDPDVTANNWVLANNGKYKAINEDGPYTRKYKPAIIPDAMDSIGGPVTTDTAMVAYDKVLQSAGASLPRRDSLDARIMNDVKNGTGRAVDTIESDGGLPVLNLATPPVDSDGDGMPDSWEIAHSLNPNLDDGALVSSSGYTNLEEYINSLVTDVPKNPNVSIVSPTTYQSFTINTPISITVNASAGDSNGSIAKVIFYDGDKPIGESTAAPYKMIWTNPNASEGQHFVYAKAIDNKGAMTLSTVSIIYVNGPANVAPWVSQDIGQVKIPGSASLIGTAYKVKGSGAIGQGNKDNFQYVYQPIQGNFEMISKVNFASEIDENAKAGFMIRNSLEPDSPATALVIRPDPQDSVSYDTSGRRISFLNRNKKGGDFTETIVRKSTLKAPFWLKITKDQNIISGYNSLDGVNWNLITSITVDLPEQFYVGMAVDAQKATSNSDYLTAATFDNFMFHGSANFSIRNPSSETVGVPDYTLQGQMVDRAQLTITHNGSTVVNAVYKEAGAAFTQKLLLTEGVNTIKIAAKNSELFGDVISTKSLIVTYNKSAVIFSPLVDVPAFVNIASYNLSVSANRDATVTVKLNGTTILDTVEQSANHPFTVPLNLKEGVNEITISGRDSYSNTGTSTYRITYNKDWGGGVFTVSSITLSDLSGNAIPILTASKDTVAQVTVHNNSGVAQSGVFVIALFDEQNRMVRYSFLTHSIPAGDDKTIKAVLNLPDSLTGYKLKAFAWNNMNNKTLISNVISIP